MKVGKLDNYWLSKRDILSINLDTVKEVVEFSIFSSFCLFWVLYLACLTHRRNVWQIFSDAKRCPRLALSKIEDSCYMYDLQFSPLERISQTHIFINRTQVLYEINLKKKTTENITFFPKIKKSAPQ